MIYGADTGTNLCYVILPSNRTTSSICVRRNLGQEQEQDERHLKSTTIILECSCDSPNTFHNHVSQKGRYVQWPEIETFELSYKRETCGTCYLTTAGSSYEGWEEIMTPTIFLALARAVARAVHNSLWAELGARHHLPHCWDRASRAEIREAPDWWF